MINPAVNAKTGSQGDVLFDLLSIECRNTSKLTDCQLNPNHAPAIVRNGNNNGPEMQNKK